MYIYLYAVLDWFQKVQGLEPIFNYSVFVLLMHNFLLPVWKFHRIYFFNIWIRTVFSPENKKQQMIVTEEQNTLALLQYVHKCIIFSLNHGKLSNSCTCYNNRRQYFWTNLLISLPNRRYLIGLMIASKIPILKLLALWLKMRSPHLLACDYIAYI